MASIYFATDESSLDNQDRQVLAEVYNYYRKVLELRQVQLLFIGYADYRGTEKHNLRLGHKRAEAVSKYFSPLASSLNYSWGHSEGVVPGQIGSTSKELSPYRRVDIIASPVRKPPYVEVSPDLEDTGPFYKYNTDLGKFSHGNFDVAYDPRLGILQVTLKVAYGFESGITVDKQEEFKTNLRGAVQAWDNAGVYLRSGDPVLNPVIPIRFQLQEVASGAHFKVDVEKADRREWVGYDLNVWENTSKQTLTHELVHVFGNYDEYRGSGFEGWLERRMYWHDNAHLKDTKALANEGMEFRVRYFDHFARYVNQQFHRLGVRYEAYLK